MNEKLLNYCKKNHYSRSDVLKDYIQNQSYLYVDKKSSDYFFPQWLNAPKRTGKDIFGSLLLDRN